MKKNKIQLVILIIAALIICVVTIQPVVANDTYFGLKIGEIVATTGKVPDREPFSWAAAGRPIVAYEWLAQTLIYYLNRIGGFVAIELYVAGMLTLFFLIGWYLFFHVLKKNFLLSLTFSFFMSACVWEFFVARPQIIAFVFFLALIAFLFTYILNKKNLLWLTIPMTYIWANSHASFIFVPYFFFSYAVLGYFYTRNINVFKTLVLYGCINLIITLFPPLWFGPYRLLIDFTKDLTFMTTFVAEWGGLSQNPTYVWFYIGVVLVTLTVSLVYSIRTKHTSGWFLMAPLVVISILSFQAIRHVPLGITTSLITCAFFIPALRSKTVRLTISILLVGASIVLIQDKRTFMAESTWSIPTGDMKFFQTHVLHGNMFNDYSLGGYLIYVLYPQYRVFYDSRADIYHVREMRDVWPLISAKHKGRDAFTRALTTLWNTYQFSYSITNISSYNPMEFTASSMMADTLLDDPTFRLIYFSDRLQVFIKLDGKNDTTVRNLGMQWVTPLRLSPYRAGHEADAIREYTRMIAVADSGIARSGLGQAYLAAGQTENAQEEFTKAIRLNPHLGSPWVGLFKITDNPNYLYNAISVAPYTGEAYVLLGPTDKTILRSGLKENIDLISRQKIVQLLARQ